MHSSSPPYLHIHHLWLTTPPFLMFQSLTWPWTTKSMSLHELVWCIIFIPSKLRGISMVSPSLLMHTLHFGGDVVNNFSQSQQSWYHSTPTMALPSIPGHGIWWRRGCLKGWKNSMHLIDLDGLVVRISDNSWAYKRCNQDMWLIFLMNIGVFLPSKLRVEATKMLDFIILT